MRARFILALVSLLVAEGAHAFCVVNATPDARVQVGLALPRPQPPSRLYDESVLPHKESCCNPRNFECNPTRVPDTASLPFEARAEARPGAPVLVCGPPADAADPRRRRIFEAPARGLIRFELNLHFDPRRPPAVPNAPFVMKILAPDGAVLATHPCAS